MSGVSQLFGSKTETQLPGWVQAAGQDLYQKGLSFYNKGFTPYGGNRVAGFNPTQENAFAQINNPASYDTADLSSSIDATKSIESSIPSLTNVGNVIDSANLGSIASYMNPYTEQAIAPAVADINRSADAANKTLDAKSFAAGAFGDARQGVQQDELARQTQTAIGDTAGKMYDQSFNTAMGERASDLQRLLSGNISGIQLGLQGAAQQGQQAMQKNQDFLQRIMAQLGAGNLQQQHAQSRLDTRYQGYQAKQQDAYDRLAALMGVVSGTPYNRTTVNSGNPLSAITSALGGAVGGATGA